MKKLSIKNIQNQLFNNFKTIFLNKTINLNYILIKNNEIKNCYFNGLCIAIKKNKNIILINKLKKEKIIFFFFFKKKKNFKINLLFFKKKKKKLAKLYYLF